MCTLEAYSAHVLFNSIIDLARKSGDLATAVTYEYVMHDEVRHIGTGLRVVKEAIDTSPDPEEAQFRILDLEEKLLPITIRKLGRDSAIAHSLYESGLIADKRTFEFDGFRQYLIFRSKIPNLPPMRIPGAGRLDRRRRVGARGMIVGGLFSTHVPRLMIFGSQARSKSWGRA